LCHPAPPIPGGRPRPCTQCPPTVATVIVVVTPTVATVIVVVMIPIPTLPCFHTDSEELGIVARLAAFGPASHPIPPGTSALAAPRASSSSSSSSGVNVTGASGVTGSSAVNGASGVNRIGAAEQFRALFWRARAQNARNSAFVRALSGRTVAMSLVVIGLYKISFYLFLCMHESIIPLSPPLICMTHYCNTIARLLRNI